MLRDRTERGVVDLTLVGDDVRVRPRRHHEVIVAAELERRGIPTVRGGARWFPATVRSVLNTRERELPAQQHG